MVYKWAKGSMFKVSAQIAGEVCEQLEREGKLTAKNLVEVSRPEDAPLHSVFNWNDEQAAELYRQEQGRSIIRCIITVPEENVVSTRAYFNITKQDPNYYGINVILEDQDKYDALLKMALRELKAFEKKYAVLEKLKPVFDAIDQIA